MEDETFEQLVVAERENLEYTAKDDELITAIDEAITDSKTLKDKIDEIGKRNKLYWKQGTDKDLSKIHPRKAKVVDNRIFTDTETAIPIITAETPEANVLKVPNELRETIGRYLEACYEVEDKMQQKLQQLIRHWYLYLIGAFKYRWDKEDNFTTDNVLPRKIGFDRRATSLANCEYIWEEMEDNVEDLIEKFPSKKEDIKQLNKDSKSKLKYFEFWGGNGEWVVWKLDKIILDKRKNPNWDYEEADNLFKKPKFPYIFFNVFSFGDESGMYDETSAIEQAIPLQDGVNQLERQIIDLNEGQKRVWAVSAEAMSEEKAQALVDKTGDLLAYYDRKAPQGGIQLPLAGKPDASLYNNLAHLLGEIDNVMGIHSTTRGERKEQETLGGRQLLQASDYGRLDLIVRNVEQVIEEWYNARLHMLKVYSMEEDRVEDSEGDQIALDPQSIPPGTTVMVKKGSTLPVDKRSRMDMAVELAKADKIDPETFFEELGYGNVEERTKKLYQWLIDTGKATPQAMAVGQQGGQQGDQLQRLKSILESDQFKQLPVDHQKRFALQARQILEAIKGGKQ
jgi:hypothetical protein